MTASAAPSHDTAETQQLEAAGVEFAYRRFGPEAEFPLVLLQHSRGNLDNWDPALTDAPVAEWEVILVSYPGARSSTSEPSSTIADTARQTIAFIGAPRPRADRPARVLDRRVRRTGTRPGAANAHPASRSRGNRPKGAPTSDAARDAQYDAIVEWGMSDHGALQRLTGIQRPTLVLQGDND